MCGIFGVLNYKEDDKVRANRALNTLIHRGPDQYGEWCSDGIYFGHRRLSIMDLSDNGRQPMIDLENTTILVVNGEIYNFKTLRNELSGKYKFKSNSDSEVLLHGYIEWGIDRLLDKIDGMFAMAILDRRRKKTIIARDRYGKKPLYYTLFNKQFLFSSEIKAFFSYSSEMKVFSKDGIYSWLNNRGKRTKETLYHQIFRLLPGEYMEIDENLAMKTNVYYDLLNFKFDSIDYNENTFENLLQESVEKRLMSDVPVGIQLSGGIDSSLIAYFMRNISKEEIHSFSIGFKNDVSFSEEKYAKYVAEKLDLNHHQINIDKYDVLSKFEETIYLADGMLDIPNSIPINLMNEYAKNYVTVILTGEGADELLGGYTKFSKAIHLLNERPESLMINKFIINTLGNIQSSKIRSFAYDKYLNSRYAGKQDLILNDINSYISPKTLANIFKMKTTSIFEGINQEIKHLSFKRQVLLLDHQTYLTTLLDRQDKTSMGASVEARLPFLDKELIEYSFNINPDSLFNERENKIILKKISERVFGEEFTYRKKMGFPLPIYKWLNDQDSFGPYVERIYKSDFLLSEIIDISYLKSYLQSSTFDNKLLAYPDSERMWVKWFFMVIRSAQDVFGIHSIK